MKKVAFIVFSILAIGIGLYPLLYYFADGKIGLLNSKTEDLLSNVIWKIGFFMHITFGGIALLSGWPQFQATWRKNNVKLHKNLGKTYVLAALLSACSGIFVSFYATGGPIAGVGFLILGCTWLTTSFLAYMAIKNRNFLSHERFMIVSYACCFAAVTLRLYLPILIVIFGDFIVAYRIVAWLCWVPNLIFAAMVLRAKKLI